MRRLKIRFTDLEEAFESGFTECQYYFDTQTGAVLMVSADARYQLSQLWETAGPEATFEDLLRESGLSDLDRDLVTEAWRVEEDASGRYLSVPRQDSRISYDEMAAFAATVADSRLRESLQHALHGRGAFRRFKDVLADSVRERERWFAWKRDRLRAQMTDWLATHGIEPAWIEIGPVMRPATRLHLLAGARRFVEEACQLAGVKRIALFGSLTTAEPEPQDVDLLVTVTDDMDLAPLAKATRRLGGHAQQLNRGADVFLADPAGSYLGRICHWKECRPGLRQSCEALHCGRRQFLYDDLQAMKLEAGLVQSPPIELWPAVVVRISAPADVEAVLLAPLRS